MIQRVRYRRFSRVRHSRRFLHWLDAQADRFDVTAQQVFETLLVFLGMSDKDVEALGDDDFPVAPENVKAPAIAGTVDFGETLTVTPGEWTGIPAPVLSYQWFRVIGEDAQPIEGATGTEYVVTPEDSEVTFFVEETATNRMDAVSKDSAATDKAPEFIPLENTDLPEISGVAKEGELLTAAPGTWLGYPAPRINYQWCRLTVPPVMIPDAVESTYLVTEDDIGYQIFVRETAQTAYDTGFAESVPTEAITEV